jgi:D-alanyl-D-alanine dipeptidase
MAGCPAADPGFGVPAGLVDARGIPGLALLPAPAWSAPEVRFLVRPEVATRLARAAGALPEGFRLGFWEGLRPVSVQAALWEHGLAFLRRERSGRPDGELELELEHYVAPPHGKAPPHSTGSAVDLAPVDGFGRVLGPSDAWGALAVRTLADALAAAGLVNYQPEWWHWSYGDEEWARANDCAPLAFSAAPVFDGPGGGI